MKRYRGRPIGDEWVMVDLDEGREVFRGKDFRDFDSVRSTLTKLGHDVQVYYRKWPWSTPEQAAEQEYFRAAAEAVLLKAGAEPGEKAGEFTLETPKGAVSLRVDPFCSSLTTGVVHYTPPARANIRSYYYGKSYNSEEAAEEFADEIERLMTDERDGFADEEERASVPPTYSPAVGDR